MPSPTLDGAPAVPPAVAEAVSAEDELWFVTSAQMEIAAAETAFGGAGAVDWQDIAGQQTQRHLIRRASLEMRSEAFDPVVAALRTVAPLFNGYIESEALSTVGTPRITLVLRVPAASFDDALYAIEALAEVVRHSQTADDVTDRFYNLAGNLENRQIEEERILVLISQADNIHELLALEARLSNVRQAINSYLSQLNLLAGQIAYSTITVTLTCALDPPVIIATTYTLGARIGGAFGDSVDGTVNVVQGFVVFLAGAVIPLGLVALLGLAVYLVVKRAMRKRLRKRAA